MWVVGGSQRHEDDHVGSEAMSGWPDVLDSFLGGPLSRKGLRMREPRMIRRNHGRLQTVGNWHRSLFRRLYELPDRFRSIGAKEVGYTTFWRYQFDLSLLNTSINTCPKEICLTEYPYL